MYALLDCFDEYIEKNKYEKTITNMLGPANYEWMGFKNSALKIER